MSTSPRAVDGHVADGVVEIAPAERASLHLRSLMRYWWLVLAAFALAIAAALAVSMTEQKRYAASAEVLVTSGEPVNVLLRSTAPLPADPERALNTDVALVKVVAIASRVHKQLRLPFSKTKLLAEVTASLEGTTNVVKITVRDALPLRAAAIANAFASQYIAFRRETAQGQYAAAARLAQAQLSVLTPAERKKPEGVSLRNQLQQLETAGRLQTGSAQIVDEATPPTSPASPRPKRSAAIAGVLGLLIGSLAAIVLGGAKRRPRDGGARASDLPAATWLAASGAPPRDERAGTFRSESAS
jgi:polysaccharide biosynthesis transport protein